MARHDETIRPRPEAKPLSFDELTGEQKGAGEKATDLLRGMASEQDKPLPHPPKMHAYVPVIDRFRSNRIILLDGARGSGKSALLVTLVDAYVRSLTGQGVPPGYEAWIRPEDHIVPVGLIDLQPLPGSSHLMLYLLASLEHVVKAMEPHHEPPSAYAGSAPWHPVKRDELPSRTRWRKLAHATAMGWEGNLAERKGKLDPDAFAVELEEGELLRLDLVTTFREFVDALVDDYRKWSRREQGMGPLFLLSIDDADMNPRLSGHLLEVLRKLWHPRLAFLLTGDTRMFLDTPNESEGAAENYLQQIAQLLPDQPGRNDTSRRNRELRADIYSKIIPQLHRCELRALDVEERLTAGPHLGAEFFRNIPVMRRDAAEEARQKTLEDYFTANPQTKEALPDRLRRLYELEAFLKQSSVQAPKNERTRLMPSRANKALERLWNWVLSSLLVSTEHLKPMVRLDEAGLLRLNVGVPQLPIPIVLQQISLGSEWSLSLEYPVRFEFSQPLKAGESELMRPVTAALMLATDYVAEAVDALFENRPPVPSGLSTVMFAHTTWDRSQARGPYRFPWPVPDWESFADFVRMKKEWEAALNFSSPPGGNPTDRIAKEFLRAVLRVGLGEESMKDQTSSPGELEWSILAEDIARAVRITPGSSRRQRILSDWSLGRAGLLAAPESGLSAETANNFLLALRNALGRDWGQAKKMLLDARRDRVIKSSEGNQRTPYEIAAGIVAEGDVLRAVDESFPKHRFSSVLLEREFEGDPQAAENFKGALRGIRPRWFSTVGLEGDGLSIYVSELRRKWLGQAPARILHDMAGSIRTTERVSGISEKLIERMWKTAVEAADEPSLMDVVQAFRTETHIKDSYQKVAEDQARCIVGRSDYVADIQNRNGLNVSMWGVTGSGEFIIKTNRTDGSEKALEAIFRIAYDQEKDRVGVNTGTLGSGAAPRWWAGVEVKVLESASLQPWPIPAWITLREYEELEINWNKVVRTVKNTLSEEDVEGDPRVPDALAYWLVESCKDLTRWDTHGDYVRFDIDEKSWERIFDGGKELKHAARRQLTADWHQQLILLAAPESGLSETAAQSIIDKVIGVYVTRLSRKEFKVHWERYQQHLREKDFSEVKEAAELLDLDSPVFQIHKLWNSAASLRKRRLQDAGVAPEKIDELLDLVDRRFAKHPWVECFGYWSDSLKP